MSQRTGERRSMDDFTRAQPLFVRHSSIGAERLRVEASPQSCYSCGGIANRPSQFESTKARLVPPSASGAEVLLRSVAVTYMVLRSTFGRTTGPLRFALPGARSDYPSR